MKLIACIVLACVLSGCASLAGNAAYHYKTTKNTDGSTSCEFTVDSGRIIEGVSVQACGDMAATAASLHQGNSAIDFANLFGVAASVATGHPYTPIQAAATPVGVKPAPAKEEAKPQ